MDVLSTFYQKNGGETTTNNNDDNNQDEALLLQHDDDESYTPPPSNIRGIPNVGNTCYVGAAIQALAAAADNNDTAAVINVSNPLGYGGRWVSLYYGVMREYLEGRTPSINMWQWMRELSQLHPVYGPNSVQQDAQEFMGWALDALHEEYNRVLVKPYVEVSCSAMESDEEVAAKYWNAHRARNDSWVAERWYGQQLQKIRCGACGVESRTAQVFNALFLGLPTDWLRTIEVIVFGQRVHQQGQR